MRRRYPALLLVVAAFVAIVVTARSTVDADVPNFSTAAEGWMPSAPASTSLTETWFCPGVPASGVEEVEGEIVIANRDAERLVGTILLVNDQRETRSLDLAIDGWSSARLDLDETLPGSMVGAVIEIDGGGAVVEQLAFHPSGDSVSACANATSDAWYLADGFTVEGSLDQVVMMNPYEQTVVVNLEFATQEGSRRPASYRGLTVPAQSIRVVDLGAPGAGAQNEPVLAVKVETTRGRLVVGRSQRFLGGGRLGTQVTLASPELRDQWWFADGAKGPGVSERFSIYNPTAEAVEVDVIFLGVELPDDGSDFDRVAAVAADPIEVPPREVVTFDPGPQADLPEGRHATVFSTLAQPSVVVERAMTRIVDDVVATSVIAGATPRQDGHVATTWHLASGPSEPVTEGLVVYNADNSPGFVSVLAVGRSGPVPIDGLQDVEVGPAGVAAIDLTDPLVIDRELIVESTTRVFVERSFPTGRGDTRSSSWAVPAG
ncbi:MAG: DUF5719 family protein [Ilumatobacter sp.]|uniref:DUF5719 family protein n=1 Tax=Ilumatobacter sp. TaxID=1967498 RepID=UPI0026344563|nr:DUF5719 family protein [Ilumatobacter sp.]MDJ0770505.1 DUF5719 family protein [Ilumatobacter sp.]